jgi:hypothetical protein
MDPELNETELRLAAEIRAAGERSSNLVEVALALGAAFGLYRAFFRRKLQETPLPRNTPDALQELTTRIARVFMPQWIANAAPALAAGLVLGLKEANDQQPDDEWVQQNAARYAARLGDNIHMVSTQAMLDGVRAQINRRVTARVAIDRVIDAFGVAPRTMKALVNVWLGERTKSNTARELPDTIGGRIDNMIASAITSRAKTIGETEAHLTKNTAKSMYWSYLAQTGGLAITTEKMWVTADDERVCSTCGPMHGRRVSVSDDFTLPTGQLIAAPSAHTLCRCNIVLAEYDRAPVSANDFVLTKSVWGVVSKAQGQDRYDRDRRGQFSSTESRRSKVQIKAREVDYADPRVAEVLANAQRLLQEREEEKAPAKAAPKLRPSIKAKAQIREKAPAVKAKAVIQEKAQVAAPQKAQVVAADKASVEHNAKARIRAKIRSKNQAKITPPAEQFEGAEANEQWVNTPNNEPIYVVVPPHEWGERDSDTVFVDEMAPFYTAGTRGFGISSLQEAVNDYWTAMLDSEDVYEEFYDRAQYNDATGDRVMEAEIGRHTVFVDFDSYDVALIESVHGVYPEHSEHLLLSAIDNETGRPVQQVSVSASDIAQALAIPMLIEDMTPIVGRTNKVNVDTFDEGQFGGQITNPGVYRVLSSDIGSVSRWGARDEEVGMPFHMYDIDPDDLYP